MTSISEFFKDFDPEATGQEPKPTDEDTRKKAALALLSEAGHKELSEKAIRSIIEMHDAALLRLLDATPKGSLEIHIDAKSFGASIAETFVIGLFACLVAKRNLNLYLIADKRMVEHSKFLAEKLDKIGSNIKILRPKKW